MSRGFRQMVVERSALSAVLLEEPERPAPIAATRGAVVEVGLHLYDAYVLLLAPKRRLPLPTRDGRPREVAERVDLGIVEVG